MENLSTKPRSRKNIRYNKIVAQSQFYLMLIIPLAIYILFSYVPMAKVYWAFTNLGEVPLDKVTFVGLDNFRIMINTPGFKRAFVNTLVISFYNTVFTFPVPVALALMLNEIHCKWFRKASQTILYFPHFLSWVVIGSIWFLILAPQYSINSQIAGLLGINPTYFFASNKHIRGLLVLSNIWQGMGYGTIVYLAALSGVDLQLYEASEVEGASRIQQMWHISLPSIRSTIVIMLILGLGKVLNIFTQVVAMCNEIVYEKSDVIQTYAYRTGIGQMRMGYSMAVSVFKAGISLFLVLSTDRLAKKLGEEGVL